MLPAPGGALPGAAELDLGKFWERFEAAAPIHVHFGFRIASIAVSGRVPRLLGYRASLDALDEDAREVVLARAVGIRALAPLLELAKFVGCVAYFGDDEVQSIARRR